MSDDRVVFFIHALSRIVHPSLLETAVKHGIQASGIVGVEPILAQILSEQKSVTAGAKESGGKRVKKEKKEGKPRAPSPYTIFTSKVMERIRSTPGYLESAPVEPVVEGDKKKGLNQMFVAGTMWRKLDESTQKAWNAVYQPLCDQLKLEYVASGLKDHDVKLRISQFEEMLGREAKTLIKSVVPNALPPLASLLHPTTGAAAVEDKEDEDEDDDNDGNNNNNDDEEDDDDNDDDDEAKEAERKEAERKKVEEEAQKKLAKIEKKKKKEKKEAEAAAAKPAKTKAQDDGDDSQKEKKKAKK